MNRQIQRIDFQIISELIKPGSSVLDLGCGNGELLKLLVEEKNITGFGLEKDIEMVKLSLSKGLSILNANVDHGLAEYPDKSFDYVILSLTLQALKRPQDVIREMVRIGRQAIVSFPNFGHHSIRFDIFFRGKMPKTEHFPYEWYDTPNIHFCSIKDFIDLCKKLNIRIVNKIYLKKFNKKTGIIFPNFFASIAIFVLENEV